MGTGCIDGLGSETSGLWGKLYVRYWIGGWSGWCCVLESKGGNASEGVSPPLSLEAGFARKTMFHSILFSLLPACTSGALALLDIQCRILGGASVHCIVSSGCLHRRVLVLRLDLSLPHISAQSVFC